MPGKVNPTQSEAMTMVCLQVLGNDAGVSMAATQGHFELNVFKPMIAHNVLHSCQLLTDACRSFTEHALIGLQANEDHIEALLYRSLMLVTALNPVIGYDKSAKIAYKAYQDNSSLKEACLALGYLSAEDFDQHLRPASMIAPNVAGKGKAKSKVKGKRAGKS